STAEQVQKITIVSEELNNDSKYECLNTFKASRIEAQSITDPSKGNSHRKVVKKVYKQMDVACRLYILKELQTCKYVINFHGISHVDRENILVYDWADEGSLKEYYENKFKKNDHYSWKSKLQIAHDICRGLNVLCFMGIFHHDVRCENILLTERLEPKITNFEHYRMTCQETTRIKSPMEMYPWMAPEKMRDKPYTHKCEVFRETLDYDFGTSDILNGFRQIIKKDLENLYEKYIKEGFNPKNDDSTTPEMINSKDYGNQLRSDDFKNPAIHPIIPLNEGIIAYKNKEMQKA
ncbi:3801_t:CDS:2, partial [Funneliformis caledonium]